MAIRWRLDGRLLCAATSKPEAGDTYIDDRLHYELSVKLGVMIPTTDGWKMADGAKGNQWMFLHMLGDNTSLTWTGQEANGRINHA